MSGSRPKINVWQLNTRTLKALLGNAETLGGVNAFPLAGATVAGTPPSAGRPRNAPLE
ncbi:hypothetical protein ACVW17_001309 [Bradyrhizobium sp. USDA 4473]